MDFTEEKTIGRDINADYPALKQCGGYDHCYVIADSGLRHTAWLTGPETGIRMETLTTQPGVQLYTSNFLKSATACKDAHLTASIPPSAWKPRISRMPPTIPISRIPPSCPTAPTAQPLCTVLTWHRCETHKGIS